MPNKADRTSILELAIEEQRRDYDTLDKMYETARAKNITFLAAAFALLGFLYATVPENAKTLKDKLFIPDEAYGVVIYAIGLALFLSAIACLLIALESKNWSTAYENEQDDSVEKDYEYYLKYMRKRYLKCSTNNTSSYRKKQFWLDLCYKPLLAGAIILVVIKIFGD